MPKRHDLTPYQRGVVRRYYEHKSDIAHQKLAEMVSELYLCTDEGRRGRLWQSVGAALSNTDAGKARVERILAARDLKALAELVGELF